MSQQINDLLEENKALKNDHRKMMTEIDKLIRERNAVIMEN